MFWVTERVLVAAVLSCDPFFRIGGTVPDLKLSGYQSIGYKTASKIFVVTMINTYLKYPLCQVDNSSLMENSLWFLSVKVPSFLWKVLELGRSSCSGDRPLLPEVLMERNVSGCGSEQVEEGSGQKAGDLQPIQQPTGKRKAWTHGLQMEWEEHLGTSRDCTQILQLRESLVSLETKTSNVGTS